MAVVELAIDAIVDIVTGSEAVAEAAKAAMTGSMLLAAWAVIGARTTIDFNQPVPGAFLRWAPARLRALAWHDFGNGRFQASIASPSPKNVIKVSVRAKLAILPALARDAFKQKFKRR